MLRRILINNINEKKNNIAPFQVAVAFQAHDVTRAATAHPHLAVQADATFRVVPRLFQQMLVVFLSENGCLLPAFFILMTRRSRELYDAVFQQVAATLGRPVRHFMSDWEAALAGAAQAVWPAAHISGCWFHFAQAVLRKVIDC